jgi:hypothetical protein
MRWIIAKGKRRCMLENAEIAIITKVNELAERHGLKPYDLVATVSSKYDDYTHACNYQLAFEIPAQGNDLRVQRFDKMLADIGVPEDGQLIGSAATIVDGLDHALSIAPKPRSRF